MAITRSREQYYINKLGNKLDKPKFRTIEYISQFPNCSKRKCFVPFSGNGVNICRLWELGKCPKEEA